MESEEERNHLKRQEERYMERERKGRKGKGRQGKARQGKGKDNCKMFIYLNYSSFLEVLKIII